MLIRVDMTVFSPSHTYRRESAINYIKIFQNAEALSLYVGNYYSEDQMMHIFMDNFHLGGNILLK